MSDSISAGEAQIRRLRMDLASAQRGFAGAESLAILDLERRELANRWARHRWITNRRAGVMIELAWVESEARGYRQALALEAGPDPGLGSARLRRLLADRERRADELAAEVVDFAAQLGCVEEAIHANQATVIAAYETVIAEAREGSRVYEEARQAAEAALREKRALLERTEAAPMWSPVAVHGYRIWVIGANGLAGAKQTWRTPTLEATCDARGGSEGVPHTDGRCELVAFGCGIYAAKSVGQLIRARGGSQFVVGLTGLEGKVVEHERGYRAQRATALALVVVGPQQISFLDDPIDVADAFTRRGAALHLLTNGDMANPGRKALRDLITSHMDQQARRYETWTSANRNG